MTDNYTAVLEQSRHAFAAKDSIDLARSSGAGLTLNPSLSWREFTLPYLGQIYRITWPAGEVFTYSTGREASTTTAIILIHYLTNATGKAPAGKWVPFRALWGGDTFNPAFIKSSLTPLERYYGNNETLFKELVLRRLSARPAREPRSFTIMALPRLPLLLRLDEGDKEVPPQAMLLFDETANDYLVTEDLAVLGQQLTARLIRWGEEGSAGFS